jgi:hypothetical protein
MASESEFLQAVSMSIAENAQLAEDVLQKLITRPGKSSSILLKDPLTTTPLSWHLCLPPHFNSALDLRFLQKQKTKNKQIVQAWKEWVQGGRFHFNEGSIIYDKDVYGIEVWRERLKAIKFYVVIVSSRSVTVKISKDVETGLKIVCRNPGSVTYRIYTPNHAFGSDLSEEITVSQDEFVRFAITGRR